MRLIYARTLKTMFARAIRPGFVILTHKDSTNVEQIIVKQRLNCRN